MDLPSSQYLSADIVHHRFSPTKRTFRYRGHYLWCHIHELATLPKKDQWFGYNQSKLFSVWDKDYLDPEAKGSIQEKIFSWYEQEAVVIPEDVYLFTCPKVLGHVFNPVHFYFGVRQGHLENVVVEINNTFGERHIYTVPVDQPLHQKSFHVSPFLPVEGTYRYDFTLSPEKIGVGIHVEQKKQKIFFASVQGNFSNHSLAEYPFWKRFLPLLNYPRILWQAALIFYKHKLPVYTKPRPQNRHTVKKATPNAFEKLCMAMVDRFFKKAQKGRLEVWMPDDSLRHYGDEQANVTARMEIHAYSFFTAVFWGGDIAFGEQYEQKSWDSPDLISLLSWFAMNQDVMDDQKLFTSWFVRKMTSLRHARRNNTLRGSRKNISAHYDLSNDFFEKILDPHMQYSSALYEKPNMTLAQAQQCKIDRIVQQLAVDKGMHVLEVGSGWGGLAMEIARQTGCNVTTITLSKEQKKYVEARIAQQGMQKQLNVVLQDYRNIQEVYDRVVSVEMIEAVGREFLPSYFQKIYACVKPGGLFVLQGITMAEEKYDVYASKADWIQKYIFPGSHIPTQSMVMNLAQGAGWQRLAQAELGPSYAKTLHQWHQTMMAKKQALTDMGFGEKILRRWAYYFSYCEAGFRQEHLHDYQWTFQK
jgi:cyclopropane-fatty-acyl-phospholipid synthase